MSASPSDDRLLAAEAFCLRAGILSVYSSLMLVMVTLILTILIITTHLTTILDPLGWGVTLAAVILGVVINRVFGSYLTATFIDLVRTAESLAKHPYGSKLQTTAHGGSFVGYLAGGLIAFGSYVGIYGWAHRIRGLGGYTHRIVVVESPTTTLVLLLLDLISALAVAGCCGFVMAAYIRLFRGAVGPDHPLTKMVYQPSAPVDRLRRLSPQYPSSPDHDRINWPFVIQYCAVIAATAAPASVLAVAIGVSLEALVSPLSQTLVVVAIIGSGIPALRLVAGQTNVIAMLLGGNTRWTAVTMAVLLGSGTAMYATTLSMLPQPSVVPPLVARQVAAGSPLAVGASLAVISTPTTYIELSRAGSVVVGIAAAIPLGVYTVRWWRDSTLAALPKIAAQCLQVLTRPGRVFIEKMTTSESQWSWRIQGAVMLQLVGVTIMTQSVYAAHSVWPGVAVLTGGGLLQGILIWFERRAGPSTDVLPAVGWSLLCGVLPPIGGIAFVATEF